ncbi:Lipocalin-like domain-containing protein [Chryseobacterium arachidis]|uniref:Lipocalin-like domain-containing protein n=1 Tax=Chryseobacterium arachidis TaxID=1416778 RepID=A0A1M4UTQ6_9FLAO|nr:lipocalin family protein [Chryseobacterium arachidis]SHE60037.1 Lipocalin-like domain-containing protein [Chryseobacterium arachidis]
MKKILFLAIASTIALGSCSNNDDEENLSQTVVGTWKPVMEKVISGSNGSIISTDNFDTCYKKSTFNFKSNNTLTTNTYENVSGTCTNYGEETVSYSYNHSSMKITIDGDEYEVIAHNQNEFQVVGDYDDKNGDGIEDKVVLVLAR